MRQLSPLHHHHLTAGTITTCLAKCPQSPLINVNHVRGLVKATVLILDDLGLRNYSHEEATSLIDILEERYHKAPLIVTSQVEPQGWLKLFEDPVIGEAIVDRLIHPSQKITLKGEKSYREKLTENKARLKNQGGLS
jgi:DNA replication protein DnaC